MILFKSFSHIRDVKKKTLETEGEMEMRAQCEDEEDFMHNMPADRYILQYAHCM